MKTYLVIFDSFVDNLSKPQLDLGFISFIILMTVSLSIKLNVKWDVYLFVMKYLKLLFPVYFILFAKLGPTFVKKALNLFDISSLSVISFSPSLKVSGNAFFF